MQNICPKCHINPQAHSFRIIKEDSTKTVFYTCPADAEEYNDTNGILLHYENMLTNNGKKDWIWVFDCDRLQIKHALEFNTAMGIIKLISEKFIHNITQIHIINTNYVTNIILNFTLPFLSNKLKDQIKSNL
jgi:hypothetical protein